MVFLVREGVASVQLVIQAQQTSPALGIPEWIYSASVPVGSTLIGVRFIQAAWLALRGKSGVADTEFGGP
jgi:TRAP-type C4-dicarboxylate transport system permease small subunit